jgi:hypothetical protein
MAFKDRVEAITKLTIDTGQPVTQNQLDELLTEGRREVTNAMPMSIKMSRHGHTVSSFTSTAVGSESANHESGEVLWVTRNDGTIDQPCRKISRRLAARATDSSEMFAATVNDPVWYTNGNQVNALPASGTCKYAVLQFNTVSNGDSAIQEFPDDYEYLVVLYASIKSLQAALADKSGNTDITTALGRVTASVLNAEDEIEDANKMVANIALGVAEVTESASDTDTTSSEFKTAADAITTALAQINTHNFDDEDTFLTANSQLTRVKDALDKAQETITGDQPSASTDARGAQANEDTEIVTSALNIAQTEIQRAQAHLSEWNSILQGALSQAQGFASEVQARGTWTSSKAQVWSGYFASAGAYAQAAQTYLASAQGYINEIQTRLAVDSTEYSWMEKQQAKLQADYEKGIQIMRGDYKS